MFALPDINSLLYTYFWPLLRIGAVVAVAPIYGAGTVPVRVRLGFVLVLTALIAPSVFVPTGITIFSPQAFVIAANQILIGLAIGLALLLVFAAFVTGGQVVAMQMGLGFAALIDPQNGVQTPVVSQLYVLLTTLAFLSLDGHLVVIEVIATSFNHMPIGRDLGALGMWEVAATGSFIFAGAISIALPGILALLITNLSLGIVTRAAPQLNIFAVGFPLMIILGYVVIYSTLDVTVSHLGRLLADGLQSLADIGLMR